MTRGIPASFRSLMSGATKAFISSTDTPGFVIWLCRRNVRSGRARLGACVFTKFHMMLWRRYTKVVREVYVHAFPERLVVGNSDSGCRVTEHGTGLEREARSSCNNLEGEYLVCHKTIFRCNIRKAAALHETSISSYCRRPWGQELDIILTHVVVDFMLFQCYANPRCLSLILCDLDRWKVFKSFKAMYPDLKRTTSGISSDPVMSRVPIHVRAIS